MNNDLNHYISKWLHPSNASFFDVTPVPLDELSDDLPVDWESVPFASPEQMMRPSFPRVIPPLNTREPMAHDGGPGLRDGKHASRIKYLLREWL